MKRRGGRGELGTVVLACLVGAGLVLLVSGRTWLTITLARPHPLGAYVQHRSGAAVAPAVRGIGLAALVGAVALLATRRWGRPIVGALLTAAGVAIVVESLRYAGGVGRARALDLLASNGGHVVGADPGTAITVHTHVGWIIATAIGGILVALAGLITLARAHTWPAMGARYDAPGGRPPAAVPDDVKVAWDALDRGEDPTSAGTQTRQTGRTGPG